VAIFTIPSYSKGSASLRQYFKKFCRVPHFVGAAAAPRPRSTRQSAPGRARLKVDLSVTRPRDIHSRDADDCITLHAMAKSMVVKMVA
jgi:hypothetical protein